MSSEPTAEHNTRGTSPRPPAASASGSALAVVLGLIAAGDFLLGDEGRLGGRRPASRPRGRWRCRAGGGPGLGYRAAGGPAPRRVSDLVPDLPFGPAPLRPAAVRPARSGPRSSTRWWRSTGHRSPPRTSPGRRLSARRPAARPMTGPPFRSEHDPRPRQGQSENQWPLRKNDDRPTPEQSRP